MTLSKLEQETIILYNEEEKDASVYTHNTKLIAKLKRLSEKYPDLIYPKKPEHPGAVSFIVPKSCICVREPYSAARRQADSARAKAEGRRPPQKNSK